MPKSTRFGGPSNAAGTVPRQVDTRGGQDMELVGPDADLYVGDDLDVRGDTAITGALAVTGNITAAAGLTVNGDLTLPSGTVEARSQLLSWYAEGDWDDWTVEPVSGIDNTVALTVDDGAGLVTASGGVTGNDRRLYLLDGFTAADAEVYLDVELTSGSPGSGQSGIVLRRQSGVAVIVWINIVLGGTGGLLQGVWEYNGTTLASTNQHASTADGFTAPVLSAAGDGTTVTVKTVRPHQMAAAGAVVQFDSSVGSFGQVTVNGVPDATTFTFANTTIGSWTGGRYRWVVAPARRKMAARLAGTRCTFKQWLPAEPEPPWVDPGDQSTVPAQRSNLLPATLAGSGGPPPSGAGSVGFVATHLGAGGVVRVNEFIVRSLD